MFLYCLYESFGYWSFMRSQLTGVGKKYTVATEDFKKRPYTNDAEV